MVMVKVGQGRKLTAYCFIGFDFMAQTLEVCSMDGWIS